MKKLITSILIVLIFACIMPNSTYLASADSIDDSCAITFSATTNNDIVDVVATLELNSSTCSLQLALEYDRDNLELISSERGTALSSLDYLPSGDYSVSKYTMLWDSNDLHNDTTTGVLVKFTFRIKDIKKDDNYLITFNKSEAVLQYIKEARKDPETKNLAFNCVSLKVNNGSSEAKIIEYPNGENKPSILLIVSISTASALVIALVIVIILKLRKKKRWKKIDIN